MSEKARYISHEAGDGFFRTVPYEHQRQVFEQTKDLVEHALFLEMGTGKTKIALDTLAHLALRGQISGALVVAPKGVYLNWTEKEIPTHFSGQVPYRIYSWSPAKTKRAEREQDEILRSGGFAFCVMNVEALSTKRGTLFAEQFLRAHSAAFILDESTTIKNPSAARTKSAIRLGRMAVYRRILTGSPVTRAPLDVYSQMQFLRPGLLGFSSYFTFRNRYAVVETDHVRQGGGLRQFTHVTGYRRLEELHEKLLEHSTRILKTECIDLPPKVYQSRQVELTPEQHTAYEQMRTESITLLDGVPATAQEVITVMLRLHQILCGHLPTVDGQVRELPSNRMKALLEVIEEAGGQVIIWANYRHDIRLIERELGRIYGRDQVRSYYGGTAQKDRQPIVDDFQAGKVRFFVGQQRTGGYGLTLTAAHTVVYYSNSFDLETRIQSEDRAHRISQENKVTYVDLIVPGTLDERIVAALRSKMNLASRVLGDGWREWLR